MNMRENQHIDLRIASKIYDNWDYLVQRAVKANMDYYETKLMFSGTHLKSTHGKDRLKETMISLYAEWEEFLESIACLKRKKYHVSQLIPSCELTMIYNEHNKDFYNLQGIKNTRSLVQKYMSNSSVFKPLDPEASPKEYLEHSWNIRCSLLSEAMREISKTYIETKTKEDIRAVFRKSKKMITNANELWKNSVSIVLRRTNLRIEYMTDSSYQIPPASIFIDGVFQLELKGVRSVFSW